MSVHNGWNSVLLGFREVPTKCQPLCFRAGEQHSARPERIFVQNRRLGGSGCRFELCQRTPSPREHSAPPLLEGSRVPRVGVKVIGLALGFAAPPYYQPLCQRCA